MWIFSRALDKFSESEIKFSTLPPTAKISLSSITVPAWKRWLLLSNFNALKLDNNNHLFHAGTVIEDNEILAVGGRVLNFISLSENLSSARENIHNNLNKLNWVEGFYRKDIAFKVIGKWESYQVTLKGRKY